MTEPDSPPTARQLFESARRERPATGLEQRIRASIVRSARHRTRAKAAAALLALGAAAAVALAFDVMPPLFRAKQVEIHAERPVKRGTRSAATEPTQLPAASTPPSPSQPADKPPSRPAVAPSPAPKPKTPSLRRELELLGEARAALAARDAERALNALERHSNLGEQAPSPMQLRAEARVLRLEALAMTGQSERAAVEAEDFLRQYPTSPLIDTAKRFVSDASSEHAPNTTHP